ncbi:hypothetical protein SJZ98_08945 [Acinetobacter baumannii]|uniref:hypothetical protein n=1 Tax=Acinetobacter baumannii TaxID=470 RepID=UPI00233EEF5B|nr:hypothetical protein [Acinetobacter baumannii]MDC4695257.1 hypothetical protein [Acinetobacter baumannii]MDC4936105.1 hypothetical protein [Acinetobacter baumannii]MDC5031247.1 hypothetical protein [Acinetobacter baumannii]MDC5376714.1 hypothetical protein [Acinetobacter baumannii]MDH2505796.1 hypothetical protein [Acinetobacter baumannii]
MLKKTPHIILMSLLSSSLLLTACKKADEPAKTEQPHTSSSTDQVLEKLNERPVKKFPATADDAHDIALLEDYDRRFTEMSDEMETELEKMHEAGTLTTEFEQKRTLDNVRSSLTMLKDLDLKTEQGRYIQGLLYQYWENQEKNFSDKQASKDEQVKQLADYLQAQNQLKYWKASQQH